MSGATKRTSAPKNYRAVVYRDEGRVVLGYGRSFHEAEAKLAGTNGEFGSVERRGSTEGWYVIED